MVAPHLQLGYLLHGGLGRMATAETRPLTAPVDCLHLVHIFLGVQLGGLAQAVGGMSMGLLTFQV